VLPDRVAGPASDLLEALERAAPGQLAGAYLVGGAALGDFSDRQSNIDLVVVCDPPLTAEQVGSLSKAERRLERAGRPAAVWYSGWDEIAEGPIDPESRGAGSAPGRGTVPTGAVPAGAPPIGAPPAGAGVIGAGPIGAGPIGAGPIGAGPIGAGGAGLRTPLTRALLMEEAVAVTGPDWPVVAYDREVYCAWCRRRFAALTGGAGGMLLMRRDVSSVVLEAARLAQGAVTGRVFSKSEAGETAVSLVPQHFRRILHDSVGYRNGANTSMYWGPFERKYDARELLRQLARALEEAVPAGG
jgi:hypothetical protein